MSATTQWMFAEDAIRRGWSIFPCEPGEKAGAFAHPGSKFRIQWYEAATDRLDLAARWWEYNPDYNIGISCKKSNLLVVDCDTPKMDMTYDHGADQFKRLTKEIAAAWWWEKVIDTYQVETPSKGLHLYYNWPPHVKASQRSLDSLLDVRTNGGTKGGYVVGAGSVVGSGWYHVTNPAPVRDAPSWLVDLVRYKEPRKPLDEPFVKPFAMFDRYRGLREAVRESDEGNRNATLNWAAHLMAKDECEPEDIVGELLESALYAGLTEQESRRTMHSAWRAANRGR
jgi:hypothetical protein